MAKKRLPRVPRIITPIDSKTSSTTMAPAAFPFLVVSCLLGLVLCLPAVAESQTKSKPAATGQPPAYCIDLQPKHGSTDFYDALFQTIIGNASSPAYAGWKLFPGWPTAKDGTPELKWLGLAVHGRWAVTYVTPNAYGPIDQGDYQALPDCAIVVKENYLSAPQELPMSPERSTMGVLTVMYRLSDSQSQNFCAGHDEGPQSWGCLGGKWFYAFYKVSKNEKGVLVTGASPFETWLNQEVQASQAGFCVTCHAPAEPTAYLRTAWDYEHRLRPIVTHQETGVKTAKIKEQIEAWSCPAPTDQSYKFPADVPFNPLEIWQASPTVTKKMFDCLSWQTFLGLNWRAKAGDENRGMPDTNAKLQGLGTDSSPRVWETFMPVYSLFQAEQPDWNPSKDIWTDPPRVAGAGCPSDGLVLAQNSKARDVVDETGQAMAGRFGNLIDRNGNEVHYEVFVNKTELDYIVENGFAATAHLSPAGPTNGKVKFPNGSIEVKSAWKQLCTEQGCKPIDNASDYYTIDGYVYHPAGSPACGESDQGACCKPQKMGLIAMHLAIMTAQAPQWVWATFSHIDNAPYADSHSEMASQDFSFYDPHLKPPKSAWPCSTSPFMVSPAGCPNVVINRFENRPEGSMPPLSFMPPPDQPNQITRLADIDNAASAINQIFQTALKEADSPFQNYRLLNAQWPLNGPGQDRACLQSPEGEIKVGRDCFSIVPRVLRNPVVESYMSAYGAPGGIFPSPLLPASSGPSPPLKTPIQYSNRGCLDCHMLGNDGSYVWLDGAAHQVPVCWEGSKEYPCPKAPEQGEGP